jgi:putative ABC transport system permease protein
MRRLCPDESTWAWSLGLRLTDPEAVDATVDRVTALLHDEDAVLAHTDWHEVKRSAVFGAKINFIFLGAFGFFALVATILVIATSIGSLVLTQFRQIGILKTLGFTRRQVLWLYMGQYLILGVVGSAIGLVGGVLLAPLPLKSVAASLSTTYEPPLNVPLVLGVVGGVLTVVVAATWTAASRGARINIIRAMTTGAESPRGNSGFDVQWVSHLNIPVVLRLGMNDVFARPLRSFLTGLNLTLGVIGIVFGLTINATLEAYRADPSLLGIVYDARVTREAYSDRKTRYLLRKAPDVTAFYSEALVEAETPSGETFQIRAVEGDLQAFPFRISEGRFFRPHTYEAIAGRGLLDWLGLEVGDQLTIFIEEDEHRAVTWQIVGQYPEPVNTGEMLMVSYPTIERELGGVAPRTYLLKLAPKGDPARVKRYLEPGPDADLNFVLAQQAIPDVVVYLQLAIFALSVILIGIALINVFNTSLLSMQEKIATVGILKTVGMTPRQVMVMFNTAAGFLGVLATVLGLPIGLGFTRILLQTLADTYGFGEVRMTLHPIYAVGLLPVMVGISVLGSLLPGRRAARLAIVRVLRNE